MSRREEPEASANLAYEAVLAQIQDGSLKPGDRVPEGQFAATLGISRTPVREALRRLSAEGIVNLTHNQGARVADWDEEDLHEVFDLRMTLEGFASAIAARKATAEDIERLRAVEREFEQVIEEEGLDFRNEAAKLNNKFHTEILNITGNRRLIALMSNLVSVPLTRGSFHTYTRRDFDYAIRHHRELIRAYATHDVVGAELCMKLHINSSRGAIQQSVKQASNSQNVTPVRKRRRSGQASD
ncbi:GntR family transcriptional regulator [Sphingomonas sp. YL-JM2C]